MLTAAPLAEAAPSTTASILVVALGCAVAAFGMLVAAAVVMIRAQRSARREAVVSAADTVWTLTSSTSPDAPTGSIPSIPRSLRHADAA